MTLPNAITLGRIVLAPAVFCLLLHGHPRAAFILFVIAGLSDALDGYFAKRFRWQTELGAYLDPLADKLLIVCVFIALGVRGDLPSWLVIAVIARDVLILAAIFVTWLLGQPVRIRPLFIGKVNTVAQIVLAATALADLAFTLGLDELRLVLVWITAALTVASLAAYLRQTAGYESRDAGPSAG